MLPFNITEPRTNAVPIIVSVPHCGTEFPKELDGVFHEKVLKFPKDTDWFVDELYNFVPDMGITLITARYSRYVIDLNRREDSENLYNDGRMISGLCPELSFGKEPLYKYEAPDKKEIQRRIEKYYRPYYQKIEELLNERKEKFGKVLFFDAHSIKHNVPSIQKNDFPELILGDNSGKSCHKDLSHYALEVLKEGSYTVSHNNPFRGGQLTRHFGRPEENQHAIQLEMVQRIYMDEKDTEFLPERAGQVQLLLKTMFESLLETMEALK